MPKSAECTVTNGDSGLSLAQDAGDSKKPLSGMQFAVIGKTVEKKSDIVNRITDLGGKVAASVDETVTACVSTRGMLHISYQKVWNPYIRMLFLVP